MVIGQGQELKMIHVYLAKQYLDSDGVWRELKHGESKSYKVTVKDDITSEKSAKES